MKVRIRLDTTTEIANFVLSVSNVKENVYLTDGDRLCINAKSFLGVAHATEFGNLWCECDKDIYSMIEQFVVIEG